LKVAEKTQKYFVGRQEAEIEVYIDRIISKEGDKDKALLYVVENIDIESRVIISFSVIYFLLHSTN